MVVRCESTTRPGRFRMGLILDTLQDVALARSTSFPDEEFQLKGMWRVDYGCRLGPIERFMKYSFLMAQTIHQGCCYADFGSVSLADVDLMLGRDCRSLLTADLTTRIALLDAIYASLCSAAVPARSIEFQGTPGQKASRRAEIVTAEVMRQLELKRGHRVVNVGVIGNFIHQLRQCDVEVSATDLDPAIIGRRIAGVEVNDGNSSLGFVAESDVALVCAETLTTDTLEDIIEVAHAHRTALIIFAVTGCNFAEEYVRAFGVDAVISEPQPQYLFQGKSIIKIYRLP